MPTGKATLEALWLQSIALWRAHQPLLMAAAEAWRADAGTLATALVWLNESALYLTFTTTTPQPDA